MRAVILDNEAVVALRDPTSRKHRTLVAHLQAATARSRRKSPVTIYVATAVRVEAGWDRSNPGAAGINRFRVQDVPLNTEVANVAADIVARTGVSIADAHTGGAARWLTTSDIVVLTSDPTDMMVAAQPARVRTVRI